MKGILRRSQGSCEWVGMDSFAGTMTKGFCRFVVAIMREHYILARVEVASDVVEGGPAHFN